MARAPKISGRCTVCQHPDRWRIELLRAGGAGLDALAAKFNFSRDALHRHWHKHVSPEARASYLVGPADFLTLMEKAAKEGDSVIDYLKIVRGALLAQLAGMGAAGDARGVAYVADKLTNVLQVYAKVTGEIADLARTQTFNFSQTNNVNLIDSPIMVDLQALLVRELADDPVRFTRIANGLDELDRKHSARPNNAPPMIEARPSRTADRLALV
jgi:hypothetical protein